MEQRMKCPHCNKSLGNCETITAIMGELLCNRCASKHYTKQELLELSERIVPKDIGLGYDISASAGRWR